MMVFLIPGLLSSLFILLSYLTFSPYQVDQLRSELMQERSARHDLEMDKSALERQVLIIHPVLAHAFKYALAAFYEISSSFTSPYHSPLS